MVNNINFYLKNRLFLLYKVLKFRNYYNLVKIYNKLDIINITPWYLINLFIKKAGNFKIFKIILQKLS